jgi:hypothetical protein
MFLLPGNAPNTAMPTFLHSLVRFNDFFIKQTSWLDNKQLFIDVYLLQDGTINGETVTNWKIILTNT